MQTNLPGGKLKIINVYLRPTVHNQMQLCSCLHGRITGLAGTIPAQIIAFIAIYPSGKPL